MRKLGDIPSEISEIRGITAEEMLEIRVKRGDFNGKHGENGVDGAPGIDGKSGENGLPGVPGEVGKRGFRGKNGDKGERGERGADGKRGLPGRDGIDGKSAFEVWRAAGHRGTVAEFIEALKVQGVAGTDGKDGESIKGDTGPRGPMPKHEWKNGLLRFENPDGSWGRWQDLQGAIYYGLNPNPDPVGLGYVFIQDATYTSTNAFFIPANTRLAIPIDGAGALTSYTNGPGEASSWWQRDTFVPTKLGEYYELRFNMQISPVANDQNFTADLDIGTANSVWSQTGSFNKNAGQPAKYSFPIPCNIGPSFIKNGAKFFIKPTCDVWVFAASVLIKRDFKT